MFIDNVIAAEMQQHTPENVEMALTRQRKKRERGQLETTFDSDRIDASVLAAEVDRLRAELTTAERMRDAWMAEYSRLQASSRVVISTSSTSTTTAPARTEE